MQYFEKHWHKIPLLLVMLVCNGCAIIDVDIGFASDEEIFARIVSQQQDNFVDIAPLYISDEIRQLVDQHLERASTENKKVELLQDLLFSDQYLNIQYSDMQTQTAMEIYQSRAGNCLSVMNLYIAMARHAGLNASFQTVQVRPTWDRRGDLLVISQHINATGKTSRQNSYIVDFTPEIALQQLTSKVVEDSKARALFFNNLGVEQLIEGNLDSALALLKNALWIDADVSITWNNIGSVYNRLGEEALAEYSYQMAFDLDASNATAINNLARFYMAQGNTERARAYRLAISRFNNKNPYFHFDQGNSAFQSGDLEEAIRRYKRAIKIKELEPDFYVALARAYDETGNSRLESKMLAQAEAMLAENVALYQPSNQKVRFIDATSILRSSSAGLQIILD